MRLFEFAKGKLGVAAFALCEPCRQPFNPVAPHACSHSCARSQGRADQSEVLGRQSDSVIAHEAYGTIAPAGWQGF